MGYRRINNACPIATKVQVVAVETNNNSIPLSGIYRSAIQRRLAGLVVSNGDEIKHELCGKEIKCTIIYTDHDQCKIDRQKTEIIFETTKQPVFMTAEEQQDIYVTSLSDSVQSSFQNSEVYRKLGIPVAKSILIHGVSGVGKTRLVKQVAESLGSQIYEISINELLSFQDEEYDMPEFTKYNQLSLLIKRAVKSAPSIVIIRDLNALTSGDKTKKVLDIMLKEIDGIKDTKPVFVVGLGRDLRSLPEALRKTDIFRQHMTISIPTLPQRKALLNVFLNGLDLQKVEADDSIDYYATQISMRTSGYVARDLRLLIRQAKLKSKRKNVDIADQLDQLSLFNSNSTKTITWSDFEYALETYRPSHKSEIESTLPKRDWDDLGGYQAIKDRMKQAILLPLTQPQVFTKLGIKPPSGLLLYGPSGCGKTAFIQALVSQSMMNIISIKGPEIFSKYLGETENKLRKIFATAKRISPCIIFIDEMDAIGVKRGFDMGESSGGVNERVLSTLLNEMDGVEGRQGVVVIGCTNRPDQIDDAILRPGRLDQLIYIGLPTVEDRVDIIKTIMKRVSCSADIDPIALANQTEFCSGADLENLFRDAGTAALRKDLSTKYINDDHIQSVIIPICEKAEDLILQGKLDLYEKFLHDHSL